MSEPFSDVALRRIADVAGLDAEPVTLEVWDINVLNLFDATDVLTRQQLGFLGLVDLAVSVGYLDLSSAASATWIEGLARSTKDAEGVGYLANSRTAPLSRLISRFDSGDLRAESRDPKAFDAFEAYLSLTRYVSSDVDLVRSLIHLHDRWESHSDEAALLSPRHFADALTTGRVGEVRVLGIEGLPNMLRAFERLAAIGKRLGAAGPIYDALLANARWSHGAWLARRRLDGWALAMSEWSGDRRDRVGEARWIEFRQRMFLPLEEDQQRLGLNDTANLHAQNPDDRSFSWSVEVEPDDLDARVYELVNYGQVERARRMLGQSLETLSERIGPSQGDDERLTDVKRLVVLAQRLAELGDADSAAALVTPQIPFIRSKGFDDIHDTAARAAQIVSTSRLVSKSRRSEPIVETMNEETTKGQPPISYGSQESTLKYRMGEEG